MSHSPQAQLMCRRCVLWFFPVILLPLLPPAFLLCIFNVLLLLFRVCALKNTHSVSCHQISFCFSSEPHHFTTHTHTLCARAHAWAHLYLIYIFIRCFFHLFSDARLSIRIMISLVYVAHSSRRMVFYVFFSLLCWKWIGSNGEAWYLMQ